MWWTLYFLQQPAWCLGSFLFRLHFGNQLDLASNMFVGSQQWINDQWFSKLEARWNSPIIYSDHNSVSIAYHRLSILRAKPCHAALVFPPSLLITGALHLCGGVAYVESSIMVNLKLNNSLVKGLGHPYSRNHNNQINFQFTSCRQPAPSRDSCWRKQFTWDPRLTVWQLLMVKLHPPLVSHTTLSHSTLTQRPSNISNHSLDASSLDLISGCISALYKGAAAGVATSAASAVGVGTTYAAAGLNWGPTASK